jgi:polysaccharide chain length determinant protein (PEP-CTERM system associated)
VSDRYPMIPMGAQSGRSSELIERGRSQIEDMSLVLISILYGMWRYRWPALLVAWGTCIVGWTVVYAMPDVYRASTRVFIDAESMIKRVVGDLAISSDTMTEINVLTRVMLSQPSLEKTASLANLDLRAQTPEQHEALIAELGRRVTLAREGGENMFRISFEDSDREVAETVVTTLLDTFREDAVDERRSDSGAATAFIDQQITEYERRLNEAEQRRAAFKRDNIGLMPGETGDYYTRLQRSMQTLAETRAELRLSRERRNEYLQQLEGEEPVFGIVIPGGAGGDRPVGGLGGQIAQYEGELNSLLVKFTENHPDAVALKDTIARLKAQQAEETSRTSSSGIRSNADSLETNPVYQRMRIGLSETEVEIATLESKATAAETAVEDLQKLVDTIPEVERQLTAMNRDYDVTRDQYETLLKRRESLHITGEVEQTGDQLQFRVIEPPRASLAPVGPNRPMLLGASTIAAIGAGLVLAFLLQQLNPVFSNRLELREATGLPVLGTVSLAQNAHDRSVLRRRTVVFGAVAAALPIALGAVLLLQDSAQRIVAALLSVLPS